MRLKRGYDKETQHYVFEVNEISLLHSLVTKQEVYSISILSFGYIKKDRYNQVVNNFFYYE